MQRPLINPFWENKLARSQTYGAGFNPDYVPRQVHNLNASRSAQVLFYKAAHAISKGRHYQYLSKAMSDKIFYKYHVLNNNIFNPLKAHIYLKKGFTKAVKSTLIAIKSLLQIHSNNIFQTPANMMTIGIMLIAPTNSSKIKQLKYINYHQHRLEKGNTFPAVSKLRAINKDLEHGDDILDTNLETVQTGNDAVFQHTHLIFNFNQEHKVIKYVQNVLNQHNAGNEYKILDSPLMQKMTKKEHKEGVPPTPVMLGATIINKALYIIKNGGNIWEYAQAQANIVEMFGTDSSLLTLLMFISYIYKQYKLPVAYNKHAEGNKDNTARNAYYRWNKMSRPQMKCWINALLHSESHARLQLRPNIQHYKALVRHAKKRATKPNKQVIRARANAKRKSTLNHKLACQILVNDNANKWFQFEYTIKAQASIKARHLLDWNTFVDYAHSDNKLMHRIAKCDYNNTDYHYIINKFSQIRFELEHFILQHSLYKTVSKAISIINQYHIYYGSTRPYTLTEQLPLATLQTKLVKFTNSHQQPRLIPKSSPNANISVSISNFGNLELHSGVHRTVATAHYTSHDVHFLFLNYGLYPLISPITELQLFRFKPT